MLIKLETKSFRVKGISFHPKRPWILTSLHTGTIQLWDYQLNSCLDHFESHEGPVRGVDFHSQQPLFVSGGDDYRIKVWNYQQRRCAFSLNGHLDYVRTVFFHKTYPWVISASDDQTCRIWNWQNRSSICVLTGHNHYVMCAQFHPTENLVVSASLDQTVRVWDINGLIKRFSSAPKLKSTGSEISSEYPPVDLFGEADAVVRHVLEGHDRGVNWASFHPTLPLVVTAADDRNVKLWRMTENKAWEISTLRGHYHNVSCCVFFPSYSTILSNSEDKSIRVWDVNKRTSLHTYRKDKDRFWILAVHPTSNLIAAGHDSGLVIFKLERERPAFVCHENFIFYVKERYVRKLDISTGKDVPFMRLRGPPFCGMGGELGDNRPYYGHMSFNPAENAVILTSKSNFASPNKIDYYELYHMPERDDTNSPREWKKSSCKNVVWVGRNRLAVLVDQNQIVLRNLKNEVVKKIQLAFQCDNIFSAGIGQLLLHEPEHISIFDIQKKRRLVRLNTQIGSEEIKMAIWSRNMKYVALLGKRTVILCGKDLAVYATWYEIMKVKSGAWDDSKDGEGIFIYNTGAHLKYGLTSGDHGIIRTLDVPIYIIKVSDNKITCLDRQVKIHVFPVDTTEYRFKLALHNRDYDQVIQAVKSSKLVGQASIAYLRDKGYPEIALHFVQDPKTKFSLALECANVEVALECAKTLDIPVFWEKLAELALLIGNHEVVELCYQRTKNYAKLTFLYTVTGNMEKLRKMQKIMGLLGRDKPSQYLIALLTGDVEERIKVLESSGQNTLAYCTARTHGLVGDGAKEDDEMKARLLEKDKLTKEEIEKVDRLVHETNGKLVGGQAPLCTIEQNWPLLSVSRGAFDAARLAKPIEATEIQSADPAGAWIDVDEFTTVHDLQDGVNDDEDLASSTNNNANKNGEGKGDWEGGEDIEIPSELASSSTDNVQSDEFYSIPSKGIPKQIEWISSSQIVADHVTAGSFESAARLLQDQLGVVNLDPFKNLFLSMFSKSRLACTPSPNLPTLFFYPIGLNKDQKNFPPNEVITLNNLVIVNLKGAYNYVTQGKFLEGVEKFKEILLSIPLTVVGNKQDLMKAQELIGVCREYILGLQMELHRKILPKESLEEQVRSCELAAYLTHSRLESMHLILALRTAMNLSFKLKNFKGAASFARRLLDLGPKSEMAMQTRKILKACEKTGDPLMKDENPVLGYQEHNPFTVCASSFTAIYRGNPDTSCGFCGANYRPEFEGILCKVCGVSQVGRKVSGLNICRLLR